jgi:hypothetical protein
MMTMSAISPGARLQQVLRDGSTDTLGATRDDRDLAGQVGHFDPFSFRVYLDEHRPPA